MIARAFLQNLIQDSNNQLDKTYHKLAIINLAYLLSNKILFYIVVRLRMGCNNSDTTPPAEDIHKTISKIGP